MKGKCGKKESLAHKLSLKNHSLHSFNAFMRRMNERKKKEPTKPKQQNNNIHRQEKSAHKH